MSDENYQPCPRCTDMTEPGDHFPCADGSAYHVLCYQAAMTEAGQPNPFPLCDYCSQIVWETDGPASLVVKGQTFELGKWRPARWHAQCAPGEESPEYVKPGETPPELPDRIDTPPPQPKPREVNVVDTQVETIAGPATISGVARITGAPVLGAICTRCGKPVQRSLTVLNGAPFHKLCAERESKPGAKKRAGNGAAEIVPVATGERPDCAQCNTRIKPKTFAAGTEEPIECETDAGVLYYHRRCYQAACIAAGQPDPFPKVAKEIMLQCNACKPAKMWPRSEFRAHIEWHEANDWAGTGQ